MTLDGVLAWGLDDVEGSEDVAPYRDTYLAGWQGVGGATYDDLVRASDVARRLGWVCRSVNDPLPEDPGAPASPDSVASLRTRLQMFLDGRVAD